MAWKGSRDCHSQRLLFWACGDRVWCLFLKKIESEPLFIARGHSHRQETTGLRLTGPCSGLAGRWGLSQAPLPAFLNSQGSVCGILTLPGTGCSLHFPAREDLVRGRNISQDWSLGPGVPCGNGRR